MNKEKVKSVFKKGMMSEEALSKIDAKLAADIRDSKKKDLEENKALIEQLDHLEQILFRTS